MANRFPGVDNSSYQLPDDVRERLAQNLADPATPEGAAVAAAAGGGGGEGGTVYFGSDANTARPESSSPIVWVGHTGVVPVNAEDNDLVFTSDPPTDMTAPTPGTLAASSISSTGFTLTVTGASDNIALHTTAPYSFSTNGGSSWSSYQASNVFAVTGLIDDTAYTCQHRVRDTSGNVGTGTAQVVTTEAAVDEGPNLTTFTNDSVGAAPVNWTTNWFAIPAVDTVAVVEDDALSPGNNVLKMDKTTAGTTRAFTTWDSPTDVLTSADVEVLYKFRHNSSLHRDACRIMLHGSGTSGSETGVYCYYSGASSMQFTAYQAGAASALGTFTATSAHDTNAWRIARIRIESNTIKARVWLYGSAEPGTWDGSVALPVGVQAAGRVGALNIVQNRPYFLDWISVATGGATAVFGE